MLASQIIQWLTVAVLVVVIYRLMRQNVAHIPTSRYAGWHLSVLTEEYQRYSYEMSVWTKILVDDIETISLVPPDRRPPKTHISSPEMILQFKRLAADRINAIEDILAEIRKELGQHNIAVH